MSGVAPSRDAALAPDVLARPHPRKQSHEVPQGFVNTGVAGVLRLWKHLLARLCNLQLERRLLKRPVVVPVQPFQIGPHDGVGSRHGC